MMQFGWSAVHAAHRGEPDARVPVRDRRRWASASMWPKLATIESNCGIEMQLDECVRGLREKLSARQHGHLFKPTRPRAVLEHDQLRGERFVSPDAEGRARERGRGRRHGRGRGGEQRGGEQRGARVWRSRAAVRGVGGARARRRRRRRRRRREIQSSHRRGRERERDVSHQQRRRIAPGVRAAHRGRGHERAGAGETEPRTMRRRRRRRRAAGGGIDVDDLASTERLVRAIAAMPEGGVKIGAPAMMLPETFGVMSDRGGQHGGVGGRTSGSEREADGGGGGARDRPPGSPNHVHAFQRREARVVRPRAGDAEVIFFLRRLGGVG